MVLSRELPFWSVALWGLRAPHPRDWGISPPGASDFFDAEKVTKKAPGTPRSPIFVQSVYINRESALPLNVVFYLICDLAVNDTPPAGLLKGDMFLWVLVEIFCARCAKNIYAGQNITKQPPQGVEAKGLVSWSEAKINRRGGRHHRGRSGSRGETKST